MTAVLITGARGQLGSELVLAASAAGLAVVGLGSSELNITDAQADYVEAVQKSLVNQGVRVISDLRNEKIGRKIREHTLQKVPYLLVVGDREKEQGLVAVRTRSGEDLGTMTPEAFADKLRNEFTPVA